MNKIEHIAKLAKLNIEQTEYSKYEKELNEILNEIKKIEAVDIEGDIMISPITHTRYDLDIIENHISKESAFKNSKRVKGDYIRVPKVIEWDI